MTSTSGQTPFVDLIPPTWFKDPKESSVWVRGYWSRPVLAGDLPRQRVEFNLPNAVAFLNQGSITYAFAERPDIEPTETRDARLRTPKRYELVTSPVGTYLLVLVPHKIDGVENREESTEARLDELEGLFVGYSGRAMVYRRLFDNVLQLGTGQITIYFGAVDNPAWYAPPGLDINELSSLTAVEEARRAAEPSLRFRLDLSLRWLAFAARDQGVDAFLKYWVAIETLSMPDAHVRPANKLLARAYGILLDDATQRFCLGRIQGIRGAIVHKGRRIEIPGEVTKYLEGLHFDLLSAVLETSCLRRALPLLTQGTFALSTWVTQAAKAASS